MEKFTRIKSIPAYLPIINIDTDMIIPKQFLKTIERTGLGKNFGCGSSREHAPWALKDFGIKCILSPSFADIFYNNCFKNGILPIVISNNFLEELSNYSKIKKEIEVNLEKQEIVYGNKIEKFEIEDFRKKCLLEGLDDIDLSLKNSDEIKNFEEKIKINRPWI